VYLAWVFVEIGLVMVLRVAAPEQPGRLGLMGVGLAASFVLGWLAWRWVEQPAARWLAGERRFSA
jgi:peptidoglycan/LPS O-acetylase OafA/YrhL